MRAARLRSGGGIGDVLRPIEFGEAGHTARFLYDTAFYYLIIVLLMNLLFGIIIDTFADLRTEKAGMSCGRLGQAPTCAGWRTVLNAGGRGAVDLGAARDDNTANVCLVCGLDRYSFERQRPGALVETLCAFLLFNRAVC